MARRRRRRGAPANQAAAQADDGATAEVAKSEAGDTSEKSDGGRRQSKPQRRGLGRGFWLYFAFMMAVMIPLNLFCLSNLDQGPGDMQEVQESPLLPSIDAPHEPYATDPPTSGPRAPEPALYGFHGTTIADEVQVATLCAGYVIVHYTPSGGAALDAEMRRLAAELEGWDVVIHPDAQLGEPEVVLTALLRMQQLETYDKTEVSRFVQEYAGLRFPGSLCPDASAT